MARIFRLRLSMLAQEQLNVLGLDYVTADDLPANEALRTLVGELGFTDTDGNLRAKGEAGTLYNAIQSTQGEYVRYVQLSGIAPYAPSALYDESFPSGAIGNRAAVGTTEANTFMALSYRSNRIKRDVRRGYKRMGGLFVSDIGPDSTLNTPLRNEAAALALAFSRNVGLVVGGTPSTAVPIVLKTFPVAESGKTVYRLAADEETERQASAAGVTYTFQLNLTTQNSRKKGRGA